jgi:type IX secretion system substrate protein
MKKIFILVFAVSMANNGFAQRNVTAHVQPVSSFSQLKGSPETASGSRTAGIGSKDTLSNIPATASLVVYTAGTTYDSGYLTGTNIWGDKAFAERYDFNGVDSSVQVIGVLAQFGGKINPASVNTVNFNVWDLNTANAEVVGGSVSYSPFPNNILDSFTVPVTQLGIGSSKDTLKVHLFSTPTSSLSGAFFVGYTINYDFSIPGGDTIGLACSVNGTRTGQGFSVDTITVIDSVSSWVLNADTTMSSQVDTTIRVQNATMFADNNWYDNYTQNDSLKNDLAIYPIVIIGGPTGVKGVTRNNLTFFGNYPNPAVNSTNIKFSLRNTAGVSIQVMDVSGRIVNRLNQPDLSAGEHIVPLNTSTLPAGDYLYLVRTSSGDGMAGKMTIMR